MPTQDIVEDFPSDFETLILYTGNVMKTSVGGRNSVFHKKSNFEILAAINDTLNFGFTKRLNYRYYPENKLLEVPDLRLGSRIDPEDRNDIEVTAKLFYLDTKEKETYAEEALESLRKLLDITHIDTLILSENKSSPSCWKTVENLVKSSKVHNLGVTDLDYDNLKTFLNSGIELKPVVDHVHVGECCNMPQNLIQLGKEQGIELLHNNDCTSKL
ncbi:unnamed protein product [Mucor hiemalis]